MHDYRHLVLKRRVIYILILPRNPHEQQQYGEEQAAIGEKLGGMLGKLNRFGHKDDDHAVNMA